MCLAAAKHARANIFHHNCTDRKKHAENCHLPTRLPPLKMDPLDWTAGGIYDKEFARSRGRVLWTAGGRVWTYLPLPRKSSAI